MKDYVTYQMMNAMGADAPLTSFIWVTVNGEDWGLYLAVEAVEESFAQRVYGSDYGNIYKPDTMDMNNRDNVIGGDNNADRETNSETLKEFCLLRAESISKQLVGDISTTNEAQTASGNEGFVNAASLDIGSMGSNSMGFDMARRGQNRPNNR